MAGADGLKCGASAVQGTAGALPTHVRQGQIQDLDADIAAVDAKISGIGTFQTVTDNAIQAIISGIQTITTPYMGQTMTQYQSQGLVADTGWDY